VRSQTQIDELVRAHLPLVNSIVAQVAVQFPRHVDPRELAQAGSLGLVQAAQRFDESRQVPFRVYASHRIRGAILDAVRKADWAPRTLRHDARAVDATRQRLASENGSAPTVDELAAATGYSVAELAAIQGSVARAVVLALDETISEIDDDSLSLSDILCDRTLVEPEEAVEIREMHGYLRDAVDLLPPGHRVVIQLGFFADRPNPQIAEELGVSLSRVSQLRTEAFEMLRDGLNAQFTAARSVEAPKGRVARRKAGYAAAIASRSEWRSRLEERAAPAAKARYA
jgi:RNA polymerase sigma factor for flagellar operon FliA